MESDFEIRSAKIIVQNPAQFLVSLRKIASEYSTRIICFDADMLAGRRHAEAAVHRALRSFEGRTPISNSIEMEALLYACGNRQCSSASRFGIHKGENRSYVCCFPRRNGIWEALLPLMTFVDEDWEYISPDKGARLKVLFSISDEEIAVVGESQLSNLVLERVTLLDVNR
jgi:KEOPS complex subunit Cgi121